MKSRKAILFQSIILLLIPVAIVLIPYSLLESRGSVCVSILLLDMECYGCGMLRGLVSIAQLEWQRAADLNMLSFPVFALFAWLWISHAYKLYMQFRVEKHQSTMIEK